LRKVLDAACTKTKCDLGDLTVLSAKSDPYRLDTDANHRNGRWLAEQLNRAIGATRSIPRNELWRCCRNKSPR
jgi:hypothetical protein